MPGAIFVVAGPGGLQRGPVAAMTSTAGWARAAEQELGRSWIVTPGGVIDPPKLRARGTPTAPATIRARGVRRRLPTPVKTGLKDLREFRRAQRFSIDVHGPWDGEPLEFVWQRHELFQRAGLDLAEALGVPSVLFVPATVVWEAEMWGTRRPLWGRLLERGAEGPTIRRADLVACGSEAVVEQVLRLGVRPERTLVTPTGVDLELFDPSIDRDVVRRELHLEDRFVIGWAGSFRRFHALELAVEAAARLPDASLLLVGDGPERTKIQQLAERRRVPVVATGTVPHRDLPRLLRAMDVGLVLTRDPDEFHYSPLKVAEYLAAGVPVVAPAIGQLQGRLVDGGNALLVAPGDLDQLVKAIERLRSNPALCSRMGANARRSAERSWGWDHQVRRVTEALSGLARDRIVPDSG